MYCFSAPLATLSFGPSSPWTWLFLGLAAVVGLVFARRSYQNTVPPLRASRRIPLLVLRSAALLLLVFLLAEPILLDRDRESVPASVLLLLDESASMGIADEEGRTRFEVARETRDRLAERLRSDHPDLRVLEGEGARRLQRVREEDQGSRAPEGARGEGTELGPLLLSAEQRHLDDNLRAIVLLSDGRDTESAPSTAARRLSTPVYTVAVGDTAGVFDLRLERLRYPGIVRQGERLELQTEVVTEAAEPGSTRVRLRRDGRVLQERSVSWTSGGGRRALQFVIEADSLGLDRLELEVEGRPGEILPQNNRAQIAYEVRKGRLRVLYHARRPGWNFHFLSRFAHRDPRLEFVGVHQSADGIRVALEDSVLSWPLPTEVEEDVDLFLAASLEDYIELQRTVDLETRVRAGAGLLVLTAGSRQQMAPVLNAAQRDLLPLRPKGRARVVRGEYDPVITPAGRAHPVLAWPSSVGEPVERLDDLPPLTGVLGPVEPSDDADLLLNARSAGIEQPLLALRRLGEGRVAAWTGDPLWSWSFWRLGRDDNEDAFDALMGNLISFLGEGSDRQRLRLQLPTRVLAVGSDAVARAVALDVQMQPDEEHEVWLEWSRVDSVGAGAEINRRLMDPDPDSPGGRRSPLPPLPPADYRLRAAMEVGDDRIESAWTELTVDAYSVEYRNPKPDRPALRALAHRSGGRPLDLEDLDGWSSQLETAPREKTRLSRFDLWASGWLFGLFLALVGTEWALRRRWGLL